MNLTLSTPSLRSSVASLCWLFLACGLFMGCGLPPEALEPPIAEGQTGESNTDSSASTDAGQRESTQDTAQTSPDIAVHPPDAALQDNPKQDTSARDDGTQDKSATEATPDQPDLQDQTQAPDDIPEATVEARPEPTPEPIPEPPPPTTALPTFPHFDKVIDLHRGGDKAWASLIYLEPGSATPRFRQVSYGKTGEQVDFWPASTIKVYVATATLVLLKQYGVSLDASATFYEKNGSSWSKDTTQTFRAMIHDAITCSSNEAYTLLLRFVGLDWLNTNFFSAQLGFDKTALMQGYVSARPYGYSRTTGQRITIVDGSKAIERTHTWSGTLYANNVPCTVSNGSGTANCTSPHDMSEHLRRLFFHETLATQDQFSVRKADLDWFRYGSAGKPVLGSQCTKGGWDGIKKVLPGAGYYHKPGTVSNYKSDMGYIEDKQSGVRYILAIALQSSSTNALVKISEEVARMVLTPSLYIDLAPLRDGVNPVRAAVTVYAEQPAQFDLITKPFNQSPTLPQGWTPLPGTSLQVPRGISSHQLTSQCLNKSEKVHIVGRLQDPMTLVQAYSDLHFVIVDATVKCP